MADRNGRTPPDRFDPFDPFARNQPSDPRHSAYPQQFPTPPSAFGSQDGGALVELAAPCGKHEVYYPQALKDLAEQRIRFYVFLAVCGCGTAYLIATLPAGPRFWFGGDPQAISDAYDRIPWQEHRLLLFTCKIAPSLDALVNYFAVGPA